MSFQRYEVPSSLAKECKKTRNWRRSWRPSFWGTMERHYKNVSSVVSPLRVLSLYGVLENLAVWGWEISRNQPSLALGLKLLPFFVITASMSIFKYHWSVGTLCAKGYTNIAKSISPAPGRLSFPSLRSQKNYNVSKSTHTPVGDSQVHLSQRLHWIFGWEYCSDP